jgi:hypothetical protein
VGPGSEVRLVPSTYRELDEPAPVLLDVGREMPGWRLAWRRDLDGWREPGDVRAL